jgi:hypothetical protein
MVDIDKTFEENQTELKKLVERSPIPTVNVVEEDPTSELKWRCLNLRAGNTITGPYRSLSLKPYNDSEGYVTKKSEARKMAEIFFRFDEDRTELLFDEIEKQNNAMDSIRKNLDNQITQITDDNPLKIVNLEFSVEDDRLEPDGDWIQELVTMMGEKGSNLLFIIPPRVVDDPSDIIKYQIAAMEANLTLAKPMYVSGYIPTISPKASKKLIDTYLKSGINTIIYDFRNRRLNDSSLTHLVAIASKVDNPPYIHGLQVTPGRKSKPFDSILDLSLPSFGIQSISNIRRHPGGSSDKNKPKPDIRLLHPIKCIHGYYIPRFGDIHTKGFVCPECNLNDIQTAFNSGVKAKMARATTRFNAEVSQDEMKNHTTRIKEKSLKKYLTKKPGLKPFEYKEKIETFEKAITKEKKKLELKGTKLEDWL